jgi:predicted DNA-binding protein
MSSTAKRSAQPKRSANAAAGKSAKTAAKAGAAKPKATAKTKATAKPATPKSNAKRPAKKRPAKARPKTSVYLDAPQLRHLDRIAERTGRPKAELIRAAIESYEPGGEGDRDFALAGGFARIDPDPRPISAIPEEELLRGFGT